MIAEVIIAGLSLGLISSLHCVGMCGPLALALPVHHLERWQQVMALVLYNVGRLVTYSLLGLLFGLAGRRLYVAGWQQWFSIAMGIILLLFAIRYFIKGREVQAGWLQGFHQRVQQWMAHFLQSKRLIGFMGLGMANGLLPCGMVYIAIAGALSTAQVDQAVSFMFFYGAGTMPAMLALGLFGLRAGVAVRQQARKLMPVIIAGMAVLLILRGLNLGIPFVSPVLGNAPGHVISCH